MGLQGKLRDYIILMMTKKEIKQLKVLKDIVSNALTNIPINEKGNYELTPDDFNKHIKPLVDSCITLTNLLATLHCRQRDTRTR